MDNEAKRDLAAEGERRRDVGRNRAADTATDEPEAGTDESV